MTSDVALTRGQPPLDVHHTGLQSTQIRRNTGKQGAQTRAVAHLPKQWLPNNQAFFPNFL